MKPKFKFKPRINKSNGQINISLQKTKLPKKLLDNIFNVKELEFTLEGWS